MKRHTSLLSPTILFSDKLVVGRLRKVKLVGEVGVTLLLLWSEERAKPLNERQTERERQKEKETPLHTRGWPSIPNFPTVVIDE